MGIIAKNSNLQTPFYSTILYYKWDIVKLLLVHDADQLSFVMETLYYTLQLGMDLKTLLIYCWICGWV